MPPPMPRSGVAGQSRMTANPARPVQRWRPGKAVAEEHSDSEEEDEVEEEVQQKKPEPSRPKATSFPGKRVPPVSRPPQEDSDEEGFVTEEEDEDDGGAPVAEEEDVRAVQVSAPIATAPVSQSGAKAESSEEEEESEEEESSEEESSSEDEVPQRKLLRPTFIKKSARNGNTASPAPASNAATSETPQPDTSRARETATPAAAASEDALTAEEARRRELADMMITDKLERDAIARAAGKKSWDDDEEVAPEDMVNDTDGLDPEAELAAWKLRELKRLKRDREAIEAHEKELEEIERRRGLTAEEREKEDAEYLAAQKHERESGKGEAGFLQRYHHKGAFFQDDEITKEILARRDLMGAKFVDQVQNREALPEYMQIRDMTKLGRKGRTKYKDMKSEDTGRWADYGRPGQRKPLGGGDDDRFRPDDGRGRGASGPTGANSGALGPRKDFGSGSKPHVEGAPEGPRSTRDKDSYRPSSDRRRSPEDDHDDEDRSRKREPHRSSRKSYSRSRSRSPPRDKGRKRRSISPSYRDRDRDRERWDREYEKRRRVD